MPPLSGVPVTLRPRAQQIAAYFWPAALLLALVSFLLLVGFLGFRLTRYGRPPFPPAHALCPDRWTRLADGRCQCDPSNQGQLTDPRTTLAFDGPLAGPAARRDWARLHRVLWDGLTNATHGASDGDLDWSGTA